ncbi:MAG TPA: diguanylate cyclase [Mycobacteriales bacterium]|nr:diguanylate cyclase [Mycobacteriales bacterium]
MRAITAGLQPDSRDARRPSPTAWGFGALFDAIKDAVIVADASTGRILLWNRGATEMLQYTAEEAVTLQLEDLVPPGLRSAHRRGLAAYAKHRTGPLVASQTPVEVPAIRKDGAQLLIELTLSKIEYPLDPGGAYAMGMMRDITKQRESEQTAQLILDASAQAMFALDRFGNCTIANAAAAALLRCDQADLQGRNMHDLIHHSRADGSAFPIADCSIFRTFNAGVASHSDDEVFWRVDGISFAAEYKSEPISRGGTLLGAVVSFSDISDRKRAEAKAIAEQLRLRHRAETDILTGIGNRRYADQVLAGLQPGDSVVLIDVDHFKAVNDTYGHNAGDEVLVSLGAHLKSQLRAGDHVARWGGEEFLVVIADGGVGAVATIERMAESWAPPLAGMSFTAGIAEHAVGATGANSLKHADDAMYHGKRAGRARVVAYEPPAAHTQAVG